MDREQPYDPPYPSNHNGGASAGYGGDSRTDNLNRVSPRTSGMQARPYWVVYKLRACCYIQGDHPR